MTRFPAHLTNLFLFPYSHLGGILSIRLLRNRWGGLNARTLLYAPPTATITPHGQSIDREPLRPCGDRLLLAIAPRQPPKARLARPQHVDSTDEDPLLYGVTMDSSHRPQLQQSQAPQEPMTLHAPLPQSVSMPLRTANSTPISSPGLFSPTASRQSLTHPHTSLSECNTQAPMGKRPWLHPLQTHRVRE